MALPPVVGSYQPLLQLASGGMASVFAVRLVGARGFERVVVMKRVHPHLLDNREFREMFLDEARISSLIKHPNIVPVIDVVEERGELFLIMEYVESVSLAQLLYAASGEHLPPSVTARILYDAISGLHAAHEASDLRGTPMHIIHRDVSPQNIIVGADGTSRVIDFGIAKAASRLTPTTKGGIKGKFSYMSIEQIRQQPVDHRTDIYAAGVVLYEALTSTRLFKGDDEAATILSAMVSEVPDRPPSRPMYRARSTPSCTPRYRVIASRASRPLESSAALEAACPLASPRDVAAVVQRLCGEVIDTRRRALHAAFDRPSLPASPPAVEAAVASPRPSARRRAIVGAGLLTVLATVAVAAIVSARAPRTEPSTDAEVSAQPSSSSAPSSSLPLSQAAVSDPSDALPSASSPPLAPTGRMPTNRPPRTHGKPGLDIHHRNPYLGQ